MPYATLQREKQFPSPLVIGYYKHIIAIITGKGICLFRKNPLHPSGLVQSIYQVYKFHQWESLNFRPKTVRYFSWLGFRWSMEKIQFRAFWICSLRQSMRLYASSSPNVRTV